MDNRKTGLLWLVSFVATSIGSWNHFLPKISITCYCFLFIRLNFLKQLDLSMLAPVIIYGAIQTLYILQATLFVDQLSLASDGSDANNPLMISDLRPYQGTCYIRKARENA